MQIKLLRQIVDNGWTIQNRKNITNTIGKNDFKEICELAKKSRLSGDVFTYNCAEDLITTQNTNKIKETILSFINNIKNDNQLKFASIRYHYEPQGIIAFGYPKEYTNLLCRKFVEAQPERTAKFGNKNRMIKAQPAHYEETYELLPHYHIDELWSNGKGTGKSAVQEVVLTSLMNPKAKGRVTLDASCIDGKTSPAGFYYKLGFRMNSPFLNDELAQWVKNGGKRENAPFFTGTMYLPKEKIFECLMY